MFEALVTGVGTAIVVFLVGFFTEDGDAANWMSRRAGIAAIIGLVAAGFSYVSARIRRNARNKRLEAKSRQD